MGRAEETVAITGAQVSLKDDQRTRTRRYLFSMGLRTVCFVGAILTTGWLRWTLVVGAVLLPYVAVVAANAGRRKAPKGTPAMVVSDRKEIEAQKPIIVGHTDH